MSQSEPPLERDKPICVAVVICNDIIEDKRTNNKTLVGLFNAVATHQVPALHPRMFVMASITNVNGRIPINITVKDPDYNEAFRMTGDVESDDPLSIIDIVLELREFPLTATGTYYVDVWAGEAMLGGRRFAVNLFSPEAPPQPPPF